MPTAVLWSVAIFTTLETRNLLLRALGVVAAVVAATIGASIAISENYSFIWSDLRNFYRDKTTSLILIFTGVVVVVSLQNVDRYVNALPSVRIFMVANSITALVIFATIAAIFIPFRMVLNRENLTGGQFPIFFKFINRNKRPNLISVVILLVGWPLFFFYIFLALPFSQILTRTSLDVFLKSEIPSMVNQAHG